jgi:hypothetical protein
VDPDPNSGCYYDAFMVFLFQFVLGDTSSMAHRFCEKSIPGPRKSAGGPGPAGGWSCQNPNGGESDPQ